MFSKLGNAALLLITVVVLTHAQTRAQERLVHLKTQLAELQSRQVELLSRLDTLNEQSKPENIEKSLAGVGSTRPEDLRELRRRQLEKEKSGIEQQLAVLNEGRIKLEAGIAQAEALTYQQSALTAASGEKVSVKNEANQANETRPRQTSRKRVRARRVNR